MILARRWAAFAVVLLSAGCGRDDSRSLRSRGDAVISDAVHSSGTPGFYFLFPMVSPPRYSGAFSAGLQPVVRIEELSPGTRSTIATYTTSSGPYGARVFELGESYNLLWPTAPFALNAAYTYRIHVSVRGFEIGYADVDVVRRLRELLTVDTGEYVPLLDDLILPIRFRIESDALKCVDVVCSPLDQCHTAGACDVRTGVCSNPPRPDGVACNDGNACTLADTCQAGACVGASPVTCFAADQCHGAGICDPATGTCSNPELADGTTCNDLDACTLADACTAGACTGSSRVICIAMDQCHTAGTCNSGTGTCSNPPRPDGSGCDDGDTCTVSDTCRAGACRSGAFIDIDDSNPCTVDICERSGGVRHIPVAQGTACPGADACSRSACNGAGTCVPESPLNLDDGDPCTQDSCDPALGVRHDAVPDCRIQPGTSPTAVSLVADTPVVSATLGPDGGTVVGPRGTPLDGVVVAFPPGALRTETEITLGFKDGSVEPAVGSWNGLVVSLHSSGATVFDEPVALTMPMDASGAAVPYYLDETGALRAMVVTDLDATSSRLTFLTNHASDFTIVTSECDQLSLNDPANGDVPITRFTDFTRNLNGFAIANPSDLQPEPKGACLGMSSFSLWYYLKTPTPDALRSAFTEAVEDPVRKRWLQGAINVPVVLTGQHIIAVAAQERTTPYAVKYFQQMRSVSSPTYTFCAVRQVIANTNRPTILGLLGWDVPDDPASPRSQVGHAVLAYGYEGSTIYVYDPNTPYSRSHLDLESVLEFDVSNRTWLTYSAYHNVVLASAMFGIDGSTFDLGLEGDFQAILDEAGRHFEAKYDISGVVWTGRPSTAGVSVTICKGMYADGEPRCVANGYSESRTLTGSGEYRFDNLPDGAYLVTPSSSSESFTPRNLMVLVMGRGVVARPFTQRRTPVAAGSQHSIGVKDDGSLWTWGYNYRGQLGAPTPIVRTTPMQITHPTLMQNPYSSVAAGCFHSLALRSDGTLWAWGDNSYGQIGNGTQTVQNVPVKIGNDFAAVAAGCWHTLAVKLDGTLWAWGRNQEGQLGDATQIDRSAPIQIDTGVVAVAAGNGHSLSLKTDGTYWAWGDNGSGQVGDGTRVPKSLPVQIGSGGMVIAAGGSHNAVITLDGSLWAWGDTYEGSIGDGTTAGSATPVKIGDGFVTVAAGQDHTLGSKDDGTLWAWGRNYEGQVGDGTWIPRTRPVQVATAVGAVAAGGWHSLAVKTDGSVWAWGTNAQGELGDGSQTTRYEPFQVWSIY